jgi:hypothetical protein
MMQTAFSDSAKGRRAGAIGWPLRVHSEQSFTPGAPRHQARHLDEPRYNQRHAQSLGGSDGLSTCEVLCVTCHQLTYARH